MASTKILFGIVLQKNDSCLNSLRVYDEMMFVLMRMGL
jgi:hypothetical protein